MPVRGVRGATTSKEDVQSIMEATQELLLAIMEINPSLITTDIASVIFTVTSDLQAAYPARAARQLGWNEVPLMCMQEIDVPDGLSHCIRVLIHWNTNTSQSSVRHVYLHEAAQLRPDLIHEK